MAQENGSAQDALEVTIKVPLELALRIQLIANKRGVDHNELIVRALKFFYSPNSEGWEDFGVKVNREISEEYVNRKTPVV